MGLLSRNTGSNFSGRGKDRRKNRRRVSRSSAWVRLEGGFAVRPCNVLNSSDSGVCIQLDDADALTSEFTLMMSRTGSSSRRARVKWRRGAQVGAEFV